MSYGIDLALIGGTGLYRLPGFEQVERHALDTPYGAPSDALVVVYCHHGIRSLTGAAYLEQAGVVPVASLRGGIEAWSLLVDGTVPRY